MGPQHEAGPRVAILLGTKNGERFLAEQLSSLAWQTHRNWHLEVSDDASTDATLEVLTQFQKRYPKNVTIRRGPCRGIAANFLSLVTDASIRADYYAYCDQDDVWEPNKLTQAIEWIMSRNPAVPALHCGRTRLIDGSGAEIGLSPLFKFPPGFRNALVQNIAGGNTMVFNHAARKRLLLGGVPDVALHDWWTYLVVAGYGGDLRYEPFPSVRYRRHKGNSVGPPMGVRDAPKRIGRVMNGRFRAVSEANLTALSPFMCSLPEESQYVFRRFVDARRAGPFSRPLKMIRSGVYRQTILDNVGLAAATLFGRI